MFFSVQGPEEDAQEHGVRGTFLKNPPGGSGKEGKTQPGRNNQQCSTAHGRIL